MKLKAFSMLEMVIVLAIIAVLMGLGWTGLINFRSTAEMQNAYSELVSVIKSQQNKAKNSVSSKSDGTTPYFYALFFANNKYYAFNCGDNNTPNNIAQNVRCTKDSTVIFRLLPADIKLVPDTGCTGLGFTRLSGRFVSLALPANNLDSISTFDTTYTYSGVCNIKISHTQISTERLVEINLNTSNVTAK